MIDKDLEDTIHVGVESPGKKLRKDSLRKKRDELLKECGLTKGQFKRKMPRVRNKTRTIQGKKYQTWEVARHDDYYKFEGEQRKTAVYKQKGQGAKMSLRQQVVWLQELADATEALRKEFAAKAAEGQADQLNVIPADENKPTFITGE